MKIGWALTPSDRLDSFQTGNPVELRMLAFGPGSQEDEVELHSKFARSRIRGEWFRPTKAVLAAAKQYEKRMDALRKQWKETRTLYA